MIVKTVKLPRYLNNQQKKCLSMLGTLYKTPYDNFIYLDIDDNLEVHKDIYGGDTNGMYLLNGISIFSNAPYHNVLKVYEPDICLALNKEYIPDDPNQEQNEVPVAMRIELKPNDIQKIFLEALGTVTTKNNTTYLEIKEGYRLYKPKNFYDTPYYFNGIPVFSRNGAANNLSVDPQAICHALTLATKYTEPEALSFNPELDKYEKELIALNYVSKLKKAYDIFDEARKESNPETPNPSAIAAYNELYRFSLCSYPRLYDVYIKGQRNDGGYENLSWEGEVPSAPVKPYTINNASVPQSIIDKLVTLIDKKIEKLNETSGWIIAKSPEKVAALDALKTTLTNGNCPSIEQLSTALKDWSTQQKDVIDAHRNRFYMFSLMSSTTSTRNMVNDLESTLTCKLK